jgi:5-methylcytosine-specific restriction endonuclease McrA
VKRGEPLRRTKPLVATRGLTARTELPRGGGLDRRSPPPRGDQLPRQRSTTANRAPSSDVPRDVRALVYDRDEHRCARCGRPAGPGNRQLQHRVPRSSGGRKNHARPSALVLLCGFSATDPAGCHYRVESHRDQARRDGFLVPMGTDPADWPVLYHDGRWLLDDSGSRTAVDVPGCGPFDGNHTGISSPGSPPAW